MSVLPTVDLSTHESLNDLVDPGNSTRPSLFDRFSSKNALNFIIFNTACTEPGSVFIHGDEPSS